MLPENKKVRDVKTLVKFRSNNDNPHSRNRIITNTLGKIGFINQLYRGVLPQDEEFWLVNIDAVITRGTPVSGVFILTPIQVVPREDVDYIMPGMYTYDDDSGIRYVRPKMPFGYWLMSIHDRRPLLEPTIHALIVVSEPPSKQLVKNEPRGLTEIPRANNMTAQDLKSLDMELGLESDFEIKH